MAAATSIIFATAAIGAAGVSAYQSKRQRDVALQERQSAKEAEAGLRRRQAEEEAAAGAGLAAARLQARRRALLAQGQAAGTLLGSGGVEVQGAKTQLGQ